MPCKQKHLNDKKKEVIKVIQPFNYSTFRIIYLIIQMYVLTFNITFFHMIKNILFDSDCLKSLLVHNTTANSMMRSFQYLHSLTK